VKAGEEGEQDINEMARFSTWELDKRRYATFLGFEPDNAVHRNEIAATRQAVHRQIADAASGLIFIKTHNALVMDRGHSTVNFDVTAGAVYVVRNPLDVAVSYAHHAGCDIDQAIKHMALQGAETHGNPKAIYEVPGSWSQNVWSWTRMPHRALHMVRYEDMIADPHHAFALMAEHLTLHPSARELAKAVELSSFARLQAQERTNGFRERSPNSTAGFFREGRAGQWREVLTATQIDAIARDHREQMERFDYLP
jgi:hypothetical protein